MSRDHSDVITQQERHRPLRGMTSRHQGNCQQRAAYMHGEVMTADITRERKRMS